MMINKRLSYSSLIIFIIALISVMVYYYTPFTGDDLAYKGAIGGVNAYIDNIFDYIKSVGRHWLYINGRAANYIALFLLDISPKWLLSILFAAMLGLMYNISIRVANINKNILASGIMIAAITFFLPWWDSMHLFDCQLNYVWSSALSISAIYTIINTRYNNLVIVIATSLFCMISGMMHEGASLPLTIGLVIYAIVNKWRPNTMQRLYLSSFAIGTIIVTFSPGIILRANTNYMPDDTFIWLLLKSDILAASMVVICIVMLTYKSGRMVLKYLLKTPLLIFAIASFISMIISLYSGIVGRSGWFAELFALIVLIGLLAKFMPVTISKATKILAYIIAATVLTHYSTLAAWQYRLHEYDNLFDHLYSTNNNGLIFIDAIRDNKLPFYLLNRTRGIQDPDDGYLLWTYAWYNSPDTIIPIILPKQVETMDLNTINGEIQLDCGDFISADLPLNTIRHYDERNKIPLLIFERDKAQWIAQPFTMQKRQFYHLSKRIIDPGDK